MTGPAVTRQLPALLEWVGREFPGDFDVRSTDVATGAAPVLVVPGSMERVALTICNLGANDVFVAPDGNVSATHGIWLVHNGGFITLSARDDLILTGFPWYALQSVGASSVSAFEVLRVGS